MAFMRYANAKVLHPSVSARGWRRVRTAAKRGSDSAPAKNLVAQATEILGEPFTPENYLLTHCTIVASVDVDRANTRVGKFKVGSKTHERKWADYLITPETSQYVNNNGDSWARETLLKSFHTFVGAHNFLEHVQIEEHSKGRIIDAVSRDIGDSIYIDILVATNRKHAALVKKIENEELTTLSMGCFLPGTMVSMADGTRIPIEEVQPGDMVLTHKGRAREVLNKQIRGGVWDIRRIRARGVPNEIAATDIHPFFVFRGAETCACGCGEDLPDYTPRPGNLHTTRRMSRRFKRGHDKRILNPNGSYSLEEYRERRTRLDEIMQPKMEEVKASDLKVGDFLCFPRAEAVSIGGGVTSGKARLLGYFLAEGSFLKYKGEPTEVQFNFSLDEKQTYASEVMDLLRSEFPEANDPWMQDRPERNTCVVHIQGREVAQWFREHGGEYSHLKRVSPTAMQWPTEMHKHVLGAWINGDGHLHQTHGHTSGTTTSYNLACQMHMLMARCGVYARMECNIAGRSVDVRDVVNGGVAIRDEATGKLPAFTLVAGQTDSQPLQGFCDKVVQEPTFENAHFRCLDDVVMFPITSITPDTYEGWVHDMEVEEDHSYNVEGVAVHNCSVDFTICTKCGNVAVDEVDLCDHIRYQKLNRFIDEDGKQRIIAELCGHPSIEPTGGVTFIEASWVETPAFTGAKMRNRIEVQHVSDRMAAQAEAVLNSPPPEWTSAGVQKAASSATLPTDQSAHLAFNFGPDEEGGEDAPAAPEEKKGPLDELEDEIVQEVVDSAGKRLKDEIHDRGDAPGPEESSAHLNDTIVKESHKAAVEILVRTASSQRDLVSGLAELDTAFGSSLSKELYSAALRVGPSTRYSNLSAFLGACRRSLGRKPTPSEAKGILRVGRCLAMVGRNHHEAGA